MGKKKTTRPTTRATAIPTYITVAEQLAHEVCVKLGTTPQRAAKNLNAALAKHGGHTGGLRSVTADDLFSNPERIIQAARGKLRKGIAEERLAAVLWIGAQSAMALTRQPNGNAAALADLSWHLSRIATALRFPKLRDSIMNEGRIKSRETRQKYANDWHQIAEDTATDYLRQHPKDKLFVAVGVCRQKIIIRLGSAPARSTIEKHLKSKKIFSSSRK